MSPAYKPRLTSKSAGSGAELGNSSSSALQHQMEPNLDGTASSRRLWQQSCGPCPTLPKKLFLVCGHPSLQGRFFPKIRPIFLYCSRSTLPLVFAEGQQQCHIV